MPARLGALTPHSPCEGPDRKCFQLSASRFNSTTAARKQLQTIQVMRCWVLGQSRPVGRRLSTSTQEAAWLGQLGPWGPRARPGSSSLLRSEPFPQHHEMTRVSLPPERDPPPHNNGTAAECLSVVFHVNPPPGPSSSPSSILTTSLISLAAPKTQSCGCSHWPAHFLPARLSHWSQECV